MSTHELRPPTKWSAILSKAVPSSVSRPVSTLFANAVTRMAGHDEAVIADRSGDRALDTLAKSTGAKELIPAKLHKVPAFAGSTGSSRL